MMKYKIKISIFIKSIILFVLVNNVYSFKLEHAIGDIDTTNIEVRVKTNYAVISATEHLPIVQKVLSLTYKNCLKIISPDTTKIKFTVAYFENSKKDYELLYNSLYPQGPSGHGGMCVVHKDFIRVFGYKEIGYGSIAHEFVHSIIINDWENIPGWINEGIAQTLGAPMQCVGAVKASKKLIANNKYYTLKELFEHNEVEYLHHINKSKTYRYR